MDRTHWAAAARVLKDFVWVGYPFLRTWACHWPESRFLIDAIVSFSRQKRVWQNCGRALLVTLTGIVGVIKYLTNQEKRGRGEKVNGGLPPRHLAGALRAFNFAPGALVALLFQFQTPPKPIKQKAPTTFKGIFF